MIQNVRKLTLASSATSVNFTIPQLNLNIKKVLRSYIGPQTDRSTVLIKTNEILSQKHVSIMKSILPASLFFGLLILSHCLLYLTKLCQSFPKTVLASGLWLPSSGIVILNPQQSMQSWPVGQVGSGLDSSLPRYEASTTTIINNFESIIKDQTTPATHRALIFTLT